jgi:hypothetical protein
MKQLAANITHQILATGFDVFGEHTDACEPLG